MATTKNHKIVKTLKKAIEYAIADKKEEKIKDDIKDSVAYSISDKTGEIIYPTISSTINCFSEHPYDTFKMLINEFGKDEIKNGNRKTKNGESVLAWHFHQNFEGHVDPTIANEIGRKLAEEMFEKFPVVIGTHTNTDNTHNHIIVCAWNMEGKKWNQHNAAYQKLRNVSDKLCEEYGLSVLNDTRKQKLIKYKDKKGNIHYYEPTERKNKLLRQRNSEGKNYDVGNYRSTMSYEISENKKETMREIIRQDIDRFIPVSHSYEHLLELLKQIGYKINDKKKNGEWLKYVSFQPPTGDKGVRDYKISDDGFYLRENLENVIAEFAKDKKEKNKIQENPSKKMPEYFDEYIYGITEISNIDENVRTAKYDKEFITIERGEVEKVIINNLKQKDNELKLIDTAEIDRLIMKKQNNVKNNDSGKNKERIISDIKESFRALRFMEKKSVYTEQQIISVTSGIWNKYKECLNSIEDIDIMLKQMEKLLKIPDKIGVIEERIEKMKDDLDYKENELSGDRQQLERYRKLVKKYKLYSQDDFKKIETQVINFREKSMYLQGALLKYKEQLNDYENCITVLNRIEKENGNNSSDLTKAYEKIKKKGQKETANIEEKRERRSRAER